MQDFMGNRHWRNMYIWAIEDPQKNTYDKYKYDDGGFTPINIDANDTYAVQMKRAGATHIYNMSVIGNQDYPPQKQIDLQDCVEIIQSPYSCANAILNPNNNLRAQHGPGMYQKFLRRQL